MTFYVVRSNGASGGPASALAALQDPEALQGLAPEDIAALANFLPQTGRGGVEGRVTLRNGTRVVGAAVGLVDAAGEVVASARSRADGSFALYGVLPGNYGLAAVDLGTGRAGRTPVTVVADVMVPADVQILDAEELGTVVAHAAWLGSSDPVSDVTLAVSALGFGSVWTGWATLDAAGEARFERVPPGPVTVTWPAPYRVAAGTGDVVSGQTTEISFQVPPFGSVGGAVRAADGQTGVPWALVEVRDVDSGDPLSATWTDQNGDYSFADVYPAAGGFRVVATWEEDPRITASAVGAFASPGESVSKGLTLPLAVIRGTVTFAGGADAVPWPQVFVERGGGARPPVLLRDRLGCGRQLRRSRPRSRRLSRHRPGFAVGPHRHGAGDGRGRRERRGGSRVAGALGAGGGDRSRSARGTRWRGRRSAWPASRSGSIGWRPPTGRALRPMNACPWAPSACRPRTPPGSAGRSTGTSRRAALPCRSR